MVTDFAEVDQGIADRARERIQVLQYYREVSEIQLRRRANAVIVSRKTYQIIEMHCPPSQRAPSSQVAPILAVEVSSSVVERAHVGEMRKQYEPWTPQANSPFPAETQWE